MLPEIVKENAGVTESPAGRADRATLLALATVLAALSAFFYKSVFQGKAIAKLGLLPAIDALFDPSLKKAIISFADPSGYLIFFPNGHFEDSMWSRLVAPLWNPLVACGYPLVGDPQSFMYSPAHLLHLFSTADAYNTGLLVELALGGIGMTILARYYKLSMTASVFAALAFVLSPRIIVQTDIGGNESFFPWIFLGFAWLSRRPSILRSALVGLLCALVVFSAHPETVFFAVVFAALLAFFAMTFKCLNGPNPESFKLRGMLKDCVIACACLSVTAAVLLAVAAPLVVPFFQFMEHAHLYKESCTGVIASSYGDFIYGFYASIGKEPLFIGAVAALLAPLGVFGLGRNRSLSASIVMTLLLAFAICMPQGPVLQMLSQKPLNYVAVYYGTPEIVLLLALLSAVGFDTLFSVEHASRKRLRFALLAVSALLVISVPVYLLHTSLGEGAGFPEIWRQGRNTLVLSSILGLLACFVALLPAFLSKLSRAASGSGSRAVTISASILILLNFASLALAGRIMLPVNPKFSLDPPAPLAYLQAKQSRCLATGCNFFLPNTNMDFALEDFRCFSPLLPTRYLKFLEAAGGKAYNLYFYAMPDLCSRLLDIAGVKYVLTRSAVRAEDDRLSFDEPLEPAKLGRLLPGLRLLSCRLGYDRCNRQIDAELSWRVHESCSNRYLIQYSVLDAKKRELWSSRSEMIPPAESNLHILEQAKSFPIPANAAFPVSLAMQVSDSWTSQMIKPESGAEGFSADRFLLAELAAAQEPQQIGTAGGHHYRLVKEFSESGCRVYENTKACPGAYLVRDVRQSKGREAESVLQELLKPEFAGCSQAILEDGLEDKTAANRKSKDSTAKEDLTSGSSAHRSQSVKLTRRDCNTVELDCEAGGDSYLILTDAYYPGWKCYVDGRESPVLRANYLFRAVRVGAGHHLLRFVFVPDGYYICLALSVGVIAVSAAFAILRRKELFDGEEAV